MSLGKLKIRNWDQKRYLKSKQEMMVKQVETTKPISIILTWAFKIAILLFFGMIILFPFLFMINQSVLDLRFQTSNDTLIWYPKPFEKGGQVIFLDNFKKAFQDGYFKAVVYTASTTVLSVICRIFFSMTFGYAFSLKKWRFKTLSWILFLSLLILPEVALLTGQYKIIVALGWKDGIAQYIALTMPFVASVFSGFMYRNAFEEITGSVKESAMIDSANDFVFFTKIAMPMVKATTWTVAILTALASWNSFTWPLLVITEKEDSWLVINVWLTHTGKLKGDDSGLVYTSIRLAANILAILPMFIAYFLFRKRIMNAISRQGKATKG
ncbi:carbohydrate ABC transporter permease [[Mycoplasma] anseris]|uniref:Carbohydrate ABC transporter permease n=1 Tax=[Mycoplasma] anseris TaxID=92400 RepID=A0A2Z4ND25_9BACT|nr:carbohydrate ABC transporter permease [[Mycoplasma] anseris]AWX69468.1 carbohydrate ABC transporter permease [[Mycoplasma] anseris]